jgi:hypothetical protein
MNQAILFNDDFCYCPENKAWSFSGQISGELVHIYIKGVNQNTVISQSQKFDWEMMVEEWLEENEPDNQVIWFG